MRFDWALAPDPPHVGPATFSLSLADSTGRPVTGADVALEANMSHPGMKPVLARAAETEPGHYTAPIEFTMSGDWYILVTATLPDGRTLERQIDVSGVQ